MFPGAVRTWLVLIVALCVTAFWSLPAARSQPQDAPPAAQPQPQPPADPNAEQPPPAVPSGPDTGEPDDGRAAEPPSSQPTDPAEARVLDEKLIDELLAVLPKQWSNPIDLAQASIEINSQLMQAENHKQIVPWKLADGYCQSLKAGKAIAKEIDPETRLAYYQALYMSALAGGEPADALAAARELVSLNSLQGWNHLSVWRAGMAMGDAKACAEGIAGLARLMGSDQIAGLQRMKQETEPIGTTPQFSIELSDGATFSPSTARGRVVVFDFWLHGERRYQLALPLVKRIYDEFKDYDGFGMIGVNMDTKEFRTIIKRFLEVNGVVWPQYYEGHGERPVSFKVFKARTMPAQAVLGPTGKVIYLGACNDPVLYYAVRAGLREANKGQMPQPKPPTTSQPDSGAPGPDAPASGALTGEQIKAQRENEAATKLRLAQMYEQAQVLDKAREFYQAIVDHYGDTQAAAEAKTRLIWIQQKTR